MVGHRRSGRAGTASRYCSQCGTGLEGSMNYCPDCGTATDGPTAGFRTRAADAAHRDRVERGAGGGTTPTDRDRLEHRIARASREGWELERDFGDHAVMVRRTFGSANEHLAVALVTVWFTMGIGNALWGAYRYFGDAERRVLRADDVGAGTATMGDETTADSPVRWRATAGFCWLAAAIVALIALEVATATASLLLVALAVLFAMLGASALPSVRRRLESRHSPTANGRVRSVDERTIAAPDRPCAACAEPVGRGVERTYRKEICLFGVPLSVDEGRNYYCRQCATGNGTATPFEADAAYGRRSSGTNRSASDPNADLEGGPKPGPESEPEPKPSAETDSESTRS